MKLANPLHYPTIVLISGIILVVGVRLKNISSWIMLPATIAIATAGGTAVKFRTASQQIQAIKQAQFQEIQAVKQQAQLIAEKAETLRAEAEKNLTESMQIELLTAIQYAGNLAAELPAKIETLTSRWHGSESLLAAEDLEQQLQSVRAKLQNSQGIAREKLTELAASLENNIELARAGKDAREAQITSLATLVSNSAGVLQQLQNQLRTSNLNSSEQIQELLVLSDELKNMQENVDILIT